MKDVVVVSPYREQRSKLSEQLRGAYEGIVVTTVAKSQGECATSLHVKNECTNYLLILKQC